MSQQGKGSYKYSNRELIFLNVFFQFKLVSMKTCMHLGRFSFARYLLFTSRLSTKVSDLITKLVRSATFDWLTFHFSHGKTSQSELYWTRLAHATNTKSYKLNALGSRAGDEKWSLRIQESLLIRSKFRNFAITSSLYPQCSTFQQFVTSLAGQSDDETCAHFHEFHRVMWASGARETIRVFQTVERRVCRRFSGWLSRQRSFRVFWRDFRGGKAFEVQEVTFMIDLVQLNSDLGLD